MRSWSVATFFVAFVGLGIWLNTRAWNGQLFVYLGGVRSPSAIRSLEQYSSLEREALYRSVNEQLMAHAEILKDGARVGVRLGHPMVSRQDGSRTFGCRYQGRSRAYDRIELTFVAEGMAVGGESPRLVVDAACRSGADLNMLDTVWIPMREIVASGKTQQTLRFSESGQLLSEGDSQDSTLVKVESMADQWPRTWSLWSVKLYSEEGSDQALTLDSDLLKSTKDKIFSFDWTEPEPEAEPHAQ